MGIKNLNKYIRMNCLKSIKKINFSELQWKKIVVDVSIYLYKFKSENVLMEQIYLMINLFRYYNITPIFIFDGKPPTEKKELLTQRKELKKEAIINYELLKEQYELTDDAEEKDKLSQQMEEEKKKTIKISKLEIENVQNLMSNMGVSYEIAPGEADQLCAYLVKSGRVYGCLSEDMDMFVYGCTRVFRYLNLFNRTMISYNLDNILTELNMNFDEFKEICILSGTDYNIDTNNEFTLFTLMKEFKKFKKKSSETDNFRSWLEKNDKYNINCDINKVLELFNIENLYEDNKYDFYYYIENKNILIPNVKNIMSKENFIFI